MSIRRVSLTRLILLWAGVLIVQSNIAQGQGMILYVSPTGNDGWDGRHSLRDDALATGPFATLERARDEIRRLKNRGAVPDGGVTVILTPGIHVLERPFVLTSEDAGTADKPILYRAERRGDTQDRPIPSA